MGSQQDPKIPYETGPRKESECIRYCQCCYALKPLGNYGFLFFWLKTSAVLDFKNKTAFFLILQACFHGTSVIVSVTVVDTSPASNMHT